MITSTNTPLLLIELYDYIKDPETDYEITMRKRIQHELENIMDVYPGFMRQLEMEFAEDEGSTILDDNLPDATQEWIGDMDFSERLTRFEDYLTALNNIPL